MDSVERAARNALGLAATRYAPDERVAAFEVTPTTNGDGSLVLDGVVSTTMLRDRALAAVEEAAEGPVEDDVVVHESIATDLTVTRPRVSVRGRPDDDGERVTELRYGQAVEVFDAVGEWRRVRAPDGYLGWVPERVLTDREPIDPDVIVTATSVEDPHFLDTSDGERLDVLYAGTPCERTDERVGPGEVAVRFRTGAEARLPTGAVGDPAENPNGDAVVDAATSFLGTEYRWGGMTVDGIDCSGLVWVAYQVNGLVLPRDADQQRQMGRPVTRDDLQPGDLLFFPGHVAISTGGTEVVHAEYDSAGVVRARLDPGASTTPHHTGYNERLDDEFACARRLL